MNHRGIREVWRPRLEPGYKVKGRPKAERFKAPIRRPTGKPSKLGYVAVARKLLVAMIAIA